MNTNLHQKDRDLSGGEIKITDYNTEASGLAGEQKLRAELFRNVFANASVGISVLENRVFREVN